MVMITNESLNTPPFPPPSRCGSPVETRIAGSSTALGTPANEQAAERTKLFGRKGWAMVRNSSSNYGRGSRRLTGEVGGFAALRERKQPLVWLSFTPG